MNRKLLGCFTPPACPTPIEGGAHLYRISTILSTAKYWPKCFEIRYFLYEETDHGASIPELHEAVEFAFKKWEQRILV
jgi:hypothetical protein